LGTSNPQANPGKHQAPWWRSARTKFILAVTAAGGALLSGLVSIPPLAQFLNTITACGWADTLIRVAGVGIAFLATSWNLLANHQDKSEIETLRARLASESSQGLSHAVAKFCETVKTMSDTNSGGWTPENVQRFQPEALKIGKSLLDHLNIPDARLCLYIPRPVDTEPDGTQGDSATALQSVCHTFVPGRHKPRRIIQRGKETGNLFSALDDETTRYIPNRKLPKGTKSASKKWKSAMSMGVWVGDEPFAVLTVDSTAADAFDHIADGVLTLVAGLLTFAEVEQDRLRRVQYPAPVPQNATLETGR